MTEAAAVEFQYRGREIILGRMAARISKDWQRLYGHVDFSYKIAHRAHDADERARGAHNKYQVADRRGGLGNGHVEGRNDLPLKPVGGRDVGDCPRDGKDA